MATEREQKVFYNCKIIEKAVGEYNGQEVWKVTLNKETFGGQFAVALTRVQPGIANQLEPGKQYDLVMQRENLKKPDYNGERDWMFYWGLVGIADGAAAQQAARPPDGAAPRQQTTTSSEPWGTLDERIAWNSAVNNSASAVPYDRGAVVDWTVELSIVAHHIYTLIRRGPLPPVVEDVPPGVPEAPDVDGGGALDPEDALAPADIRYITDALDAEEGRDSIVI